MHKEPMTKAERQEQRRLQPQGYRAALENEAERIEGTLRIAAAAGERPDGPLRNGSSLAQAMAVFESDARRNGRAGEFASVCAKVCTDYDVPFPSHLASTLTQHQGASGFPMNLGNVMERQPGETMTQHAERMTAHMRGQQHPASPKQSGDIGDQVADVLCPTTA